MAEFLVTKLCLATLFLFFIINCVSCAAFVQPKAQAHPHPKILPKAQPKPLPKSNLLSCDSKSPQASGFHCNAPASVQEHCSTFVLFRANSHYSSLHNITFYLSFNRKVLDGANGFTPKNDLLVKDQAILIPIECKCNGSFFQSDVTKTTIKKDGFYEIAESLEGLTTCKAIQEKNKGISPRDLKEKLRLLVPLRCACPTQLELKQKTAMLLSYPVAVGDTIQNVASKFKVTPAAIISANSRSGPFKPTKLEPLSTLLIPLAKKPAIIPGIGFSKPPKLAKLNVTNKPFVKPAMQKPKKKKKKNMVGVYAGVAVVGIVAIIGVGAAIFVTQSKKQKLQDLSKRNDDVELHHLSIRTKSEIKTVSEFSHDPLDGPIMDVTPHKMGVGTYSTEELQRATDDFHPSNLIEGFTFHGRLSGKNLAIKRTQPDAIAKMEFGLFHDAYHHHPNILRLLGTCLIDGPDSFLVFEYAKNGSLKDWLHGGLAMKSQFIASCYCFLTWKQRMKICLDVAMGLRYMHHVMNPIYVHRNIKSRNILLDDEFNAKIGNFGMSRCVQDDADDSKSLLTHPATWSRGYLAPEYLKHGIISSSIDIFAYGVVLLEVLSGKTPATRADDKGEGSILLSNKIKSILASSNCNNELKDWMDHAMGDAYSFDTALTLAKLAKECVEDEPALRPTAKEIVDKLSRLVDELPDGDQISSSGSSSKSQVKVRSNDHA
ncbi:hypothetical protein MKW98_002688 [Papaver atlanticum]|uniref:Uncharacterized protein n=1 Tax=Papaver atlanticum TaxID=357466 RepID=A0AAD4SBS1_9MAGN|nr:hypothetical protein MKW98_002688 [Papaver atlanticum]